MHILVDKHIDCDVKWSISVQSYILSILVFYYNSRHYPLRCVPGDPLSPAVKSKARAQPRHRGRAATSRSRDLVWSKVAVVFVVDRPTNHRRSLSVAVFVMIATGRVTR